MSHKANNPKHKPIQTKFLGSCFSGLTKFAQPPQSCEDSFPSKDTTSSNEVHTSIRFLKRQKILKKQNETSKKNLKLARGWG
jgi:hypothetical protein